MTEDLTPIYEDVSIEDWADKIYKTKVEELTKIVEQKKKEFDAYVEIISSPNRPSINTALEGLAVGVDMLALKFKLAGLLKHGRK